MRGFVVGLGCRFRVGCGHVDNLRCYIADYSLDGDVECDGEQRAVTVRYRPVPVLILGQGRFRYGRDVVQFGQRHTAVHAHESETCQAALTAEHSERPESRLMLRWRWENSTRGGHDRAAVAQSFLDPRIVVSENLRWHQIVVPRHEIPLHQLVD